MARLELALLGGFHAAIDGTPISGFDGDKTRALLVYLAVEAAYPQRREALAGLLWPEFSDDAARRNLRYSLFKLRQALGEDEKEKEREKEKEKERESAPGYLLITPQTVGLDPAADYGLDVTSFVHHIAACRTHRHRKLAACTTCHAHFQQAAVLYRGEFLNGFSLPDCLTFEEWLLVKRDGLHHAAVEALGSLALYHETRAEHEAALQYIHRQLALEPWREEAHRQAMRLLAQTGQRSSALAQYVACRNALAEHLNAEPSAETMELYEQLKRHVSSTDGGMPAPSGPEPGPIPGGRRATQLPRPLTPFIGREAELRTLMGWLDSPDYPLLTIVGPGGVGKTRLALEAATAQVGAFEDGVYWVSLAAVSASDTPEVLAGTIAQALHMQLGPAPDPATQLAHYLHDKELLLVLDNFEQLLPGGAATELLLTLLRDAPRLCLLVTSRERLGLQAESLLDLAGLPLPEADDGRWTMDDADRALSSIVHPSQAQDPSSDALASFSAVQLFVERAKQANAAFTLSPETARGVVEICRLVAGLPLGIVLAAAWVRHFAPDRIAASIRANLDFLTSRARDSSPQHASLRAVFNHSWNLLPEEERRVLRGLSVFRGGWDEEAANAILDLRVPLVGGFSILESGPGPGDSKIQNQLLSLVDKSLLRRDASGRFDLHEVLRQYATEKLAELPEERDELAHRHARYFLELAEAAAMHFREGGEQDKWLARLELEHDNLRAVLEWAIEGGSESDRIEVGLRLGGALARFWFTRGYFAEGRRALESILSLSTEYRVPSTEDQVRQPAQYSVLGTQYLYRAKALQAAGDLRRAQGDYATARLLFEESLAIYRELGTKKEIAVALIRLGIVAFNEGDNTLVRVLGEESLAISRELGNKRDIVIALGLLGTISYMEGDYLAARPAIEESVRIHRETGDTFNLAIELNNLGNVALMMGDHAEARARHAEALAVRRELGDKWGIAISLIGLGGAVALAGELEKGTRVLGAADALLSEIGVILESDDRIPYEYSVSYVRAQLGEEAFATAWAEGREMSIEQAIEYTLGGKDSH